ncbi:histidyl-tRNA synthetase [candidate division WOR-1 bacterium DG_54_3]|uniref:Histidine--tRNA ligase n=1 Tax=candidate division WOR-1 bacterium DG_54_3 TaxID=1703775 RepID=A0A0S7XW07_UNCSA|nr:MAG: histidyl-tRNA synthetase [candidate division WOR-1 bacterium DG_54_3]
MKYAIPRGTKDILPAEALLWQSIEAASRKIFELYNYKEIRTPIFEMTELFTRSIGKTTDIVKKEMYEFKDRKGRSLTLRPEETAPVVRACLENNLISPDRITKLYYIGPMFRYERPQAGRQRQFHQAGVEAFGSADPLIDVEIILMNVQLFKEIGLKDLEVNINSVGCKKCQPEFRKELKAYFRDNIKNMCKDCKARFEYNPLRILDCKEDKCQKYIEEAPASVDTLCNECKNHFEEMIKMLDYQKVNLKVNKRLVRGLDYYTKTTFEVVSRELGAQNAVSGGGRYDTLVQELGGKPTPAVGFAIGTERVIEVLKQSNVPFPPSRVAGLYIATIGEEARRLGFDLLSKAREKGVAADMDYLGKSLKAQMKTADRMGAKKVYIIGEDELKKGCGILKDMKTGEQREVLFDSLEEAIR